MSREDKTITELKEFLDMLSKPQSKKFMKKLKKLF